MDFSQRPIAELALIVAQHLQSRGIEVVLVGGLAVELYSQNLYLTKDIDMVNTNYKKPKELSKAMAELGFQKKGRVYVNPTTEITVEFPSGPLTAGDELITHTSKFTVSGGVIPILNLPDIIKDRLAAFLHWQDKQSLVQALALFNQHSVKPSKFKSFCDAEGNKHTYKLLTQLLKTAKEENLKTMEQLEMLVTQTFINEL